MLKTRKSLIVCFVVIYSGLSGLAGFVAHMHAGRERMVHRVEELERQVTELNKKPRTIITVSESGATIVEDVSNGNSSRKRGK